MSESCERCGRVECQRSVAWQEYLDADKEEDDSRTYDAYYTADSECRRIAMGINWQDRALAAEDRLSRLAKLLLGCADELAGALADLGDDDEPEMDDFIAECRVAASDALPDPRRDPGGKEKT